MANHNANRTQMLEFIRQYKIEHQGSSPTRQEIADHLGLSKGLVQYHMARLKAAGALDYSVYEQRQISLPGETHIYIPPAA